MRLSAATALFFWAQLAKPQVVSRLSGLGILKTCDDLERILPDYYWISSKFGYVWR